MLLPFSHSLFTLFFVNFQGRFRAGVEAKLKAAREKAERSLRDTDKESSCSYKTRSSVRYKRIAFCYYVHVVSFAESRIIMDKRWIVPFPDVRKLWRYRRYKLSKKRMVILKRIISLKFSHKNALRMLLISSYKTNMPQLTNSCIILMICWHNYWIVDSPISAVEGVRGTGA